VRDVCRRTVQVLLLVGRWWGLGLALARRTARPPDTELDALRERVARLRSGLEQLFRRRHVHHDAEAVSYALSVAVADSAEAACSLRFLSLRHRSQ